MTGTSPHGFTRRLLFMLAGPLIWFAHFSFIYGAAGFGGAFGLMRRTFAICHGARRFSPAAPLPLSCGGGHTIPLPGDWLSCRSWQSLSKRWSSGWFRRD